jgi:hypothetical protein
MMEENEAPGESLASCSTFVAAGLAGGDLKFDIHVSSTVSINCGSNCTLLSLDGVLGIQFLLLFELLLVDHVTQKKTQHKTSMSISTPSPYMVDLVFKCSENKLHFQQSPFGGERVF